MILSEFAKQTWVLTKKDLLLVARRRWFSTFIRAVAFPIVLTVIIASVKDWIHNDGGYGVGTPSPIRTLPDAFNAVGDARKDFIIVDRGFRESDVRFVIDELSDLARNGSRNLHILPDETDIPNICPASSKGVTGCFAVVDFWSSPMAGPDAIWNYTIWQDSVIHGANVNSDSNSVQLYTFPLQQAVFSLISQRNNGSALPDTILQYPYTRQSQAQVDFTDDKFFGLLVTQAIAFVLFIAICGIAYHLTGHVVRQREEGMLQLIDAQMPNKSRWECLTARMLATHLAFDLIYMPAWIVCGAVVGTEIYPHSNAGWFVLLYILGGLAMTSFSILASSLFRRMQLSAISAIVAALAFAIVAQFSQSGQKSTSSAAAIATGLLFPPSSFVYFLVSAAVSEIFSQPLRPNQEISNILGGLLSIRIWNLTPVYFIGFFIFQIVLYPILAMVIERFLWGSSFKGRHFRTSEEMEGNALRISEFSKRYNKAAKKRDRTLAVDKLSLDLYAGSITVLLGANGSGKSTTLNSIAGLESITEGRIDIDGSGGIGLCPQKNVMWADMTVEEHVRFFQQLKNPSMSRQAGREEVKRLIDGCDLSRKTHAKSKTLSGGQQRKLQLSMMLAGGSKVCCIDEASSGIDPLARRKVWDILLRERGSRTLLLTTHFLDESEVLADHIALLSKGRLIAEGSVASLKSSLGGGYRVIVPILEDSDRSDRSLLVTLPATVTSHHGDHGILEVPDSETLTHLLGKLEERGFSDYKIEGPSIEKIFLRLADEMKFEQAQLPKSDAERSPSADTELPMELHAGKGCGPFKQTWVLFRKRVTILKHNFMPYVAALFVPLVVAGLVTRFLLNVDSYGLTCADPNSYSYSYYIKPQSLPPSFSGYLIGPPGGVNLSTLVPCGTFYSDICYNDNYYPPDEATSLSNFNQQINATHDQYGGYYIDASGPPVLAWQASEYPPNLYILGLLDMALTNTSVAISYQNFNSGYAPRDFFQSLVGVFTTLGFILFPGLFALYPTRERLQKVREMHYSNGILSAPLWTAYAMFDFCFLLLISVLSTVIWLVTDYSWYGLGYLFVVFLLYGMAATAYSYVISLFAPSQLAAIAMTCIVQVVIAMLFFVGCFLTVDMADLNQIYSQLEILFYTIGLICPAVSLLRALLVCLNVYAISCRGEYLASYPGGINLYGGPILYLILQFFLLVAFLIFWESGRSFEAFGIRLRSRKAVVGTKDVEKESDAGSEERDIIATNAAEDRYRLSPSNGGLRVQHISKRFGNNQAVDDISFGVLPSEKFALLGPNGAGKSTMISLIRGELQHDHTTGSEIHISGDSLESTPVAAKQHLGVCPQFDAVDSMTLSEHLHFYARARGVTGKQKDENIREIIHRLGLEDHKNKLVKKLSGGTKRKLSLGIALVGNPSVLLLDEPSSGMDAAAKRALWGTLGAISAGRSLVITTHSMEEADALCDRAGIMASQMLTLGTISSLHQQHGDRVYVQLVHENAPRSSPEEMARLWEWVESTFLVAEMERIVGGQARLAIPIRRDPSASKELLDGSNMARLFAAIEAKKEEMNIRDYSVGHATLEQVFLNVVARHGVDEENSHATERRSIVQRLMGR